jgi:DeoR/GlpR family transcriptional regulator of sugar metabolism
MGKVDVIKFCMAYKGSWFTIAELSKELGISERNIRRSVIALEADNVLRGRCRGNYRNWNREFTINLDYD